MVDDEHAVEIVMPGASHLEGRGDAVCNRREFLESLPEARPKDERRATAAQASTGVRPGFARGEERELMERERRRRGREICAPLRPRAA